VTGFQVSLLRLAGWGGGQTNFRFQEKEIQALKSGILESLALTIHD